MNIHERLAEFPAWVARRDWDGLESEFRRSAEELCGKKKATRVAEIDLDGYSRSLEKAFKGALSSASRNQAAAIYFEYDLDNLWGSAFFICPSYRPESAGDDDWACDSIDILEASSQDDFAEIYQESGFDRSPDAVGATLFLVARTVATLGRILDRHPAPGLAICAAFHDQNPILRLQEGQARASAAAPATPPEAVDEIRLYLLHNYRELTKPWDKFDADAAARLISSGRVVLNRCARCAALAKTPKARQCLSCGYDWH